MANILKKTDRVDPLTVKQNKLKSTQGKGSFKRKYCVDKYLQNYSDINWEKTRTQAYHD